jgi:ankyrin repeat protein
MLSHTKNEKIEKLAKEMIEAVKNGNEQNVKHKLKKLSAEKAKLVVNYQNEQGDTVLHLAARNGHLKMVEQFLTCGANPNLKGHFGETSLHCAAFANHVEMIQKLLEAGADDSVGNNDAAKPIHVAAMQGSAEAVAALIRNKQSLKLIWKEERTPFYAAAMNGKVNVILVLLQKGDDINQVNLYDLKKSALHVAAINDDIGLAHCLINNGADINQTDGSGFTPLQRCAMQPDVSFDVAKILMDDPDIKVNVSPSPFLLLANCKDQTSPKIVEFANCLIAHQCDLEAVNHDGETAFEVLDARVDGMSENERGLYQLLEKTRKSGSFNQKMKK